MSGIFDENNMRERLHKYIPKGETLLAGIHCVNKELHIFRNYKNSVPYEDKVIKVDDEETKILQVSKRKYSTDDLYIGITQNYFIFTTSLESSRFYYEFQYVKEDVSMDSEDVEDFVYLVDVGHCYKLTDIVKCTYKSQLFGAIKCELEFKDKSKFKLLLPKKAGLEKGMPNHAEYREKIMASLER